MGNKAGHVMWPTMADCHCSRKEASGSEWSSFNGRQPRPQMLKVNKQIDDISKYLLRMRPETTRISTHI